MLAHLQWCDGVLGESGMGVRGEQGPLCPLHLLPEVRILKLILDTSGDRSACAWDVLLLPVLHS